MSDLTPYNNESPKKNLLFVTQLVYILHGLSIVIGLMTGATIISAFYSAGPLLRRLFSITSWRLMPGGLFFNRTFPGKFALFGMA